MKTQLQVAWDGLTDEDRTKLKAVGIDGPEKAVEVGNLIVGAFSKISVNIGEAFNQLLDSIRPMLEALNKLKVMPKAKPKSRGW